jgi:hypothetical protein
VDTAIAESPLVEEDSGSAVFAGGTYIFGNARKPELFISSERASEWSWRTNFGYQADGNIVSEIDQGEFRKSEFADTHIGGITFARLLTDGPRIDFVGKFAVFRHFEEDEGVAVIPLTRFGLMGEFAATGVKFNYRPLAP